MFDGNLKLIRTITQCLEFDNDVLRNVDLDGCYNRCKDNFIRDSTHEQCLSPMTICKKLAATLNAAERLLLVSAASLRKLNAQTIALASGVLDSEREETVSTRMRQIPRKLIVWK